ncbi:alcohol dehydrogenase catalytic domain-containing protein [Fredinandcohnia humi]
MSDYKKNKSMLGIVYDYEKSNDTIKLQSLAIPTLSEGEVLVNLKAAALNRRDYYIINRAPFTKKWSPFVPGGDGAGIVIEISDGVQGLTVGDEVIINPFLFCGECHYCKEGKHALCFVDEDLGGPRNGTFAEYIAIPAKNLIKKPEHLTFEEAAALPLALGTAWRVISQAKLSKGETVLIQGIGSGVATFMLQIAVILGAKVIVTSSSNSKIMNALEVGAFAGINYNEENVFEKVMKLTHGIGVDLALDSSGKASFKQSVDSLKKGGRIVAFGTTTGLMEINFVDLIMKQASVITSNMFGKKELEDAINFYRTHQLRPVISEVYPIKNIHQAFEQMKTHSQFGKLVIKI